jgi:hypothetical protein
LLLQLLARSFARDGVLLSAVVVSIMTSSATAAVAAAAAANRALAACRSSVDRAGAAALAVDRPTDG